MSDTFIRRRPGDEQKPGRVKRVFGKFRSRHPYVSRAVRNLAIAGAVTAPLALGARSQLGKVGRVTSEFGLKAGEKVLRRGRRLEQAAYAVGIPSATLAVVGPHNLYLNERERDRAAFSRPARTVVVIQRRRGAPTVRRELKF